MRTTQTKIALKKKGKLKMEQEILQIIKEKLPAIQAQAIADFVAEAKEVKVQRNRLDANRVVQEKAHNKTNAEIKELRAKLEAVQGIEVREKVVKDLELQNAVDAQKLKGAEEKVTLVKEMFRTVFANATIKRNLTGSVPVPISNNGNYPATMQTQTDEITTTE